MRQDESGRWRVYREGADLRLQVNGSCVVAGESKPCMQHGVEIEYESPTDSTRLECVATFNNSMQVVTPSAIEAPATREFAFSLELKGQRGRESYPGYTIPNGKPSTDRTTIRCHLAGRQVLEYTSSVTEAP